MRGSNQGGIKSVGGWVAAILVADLQQLWWLNLGQGEQQELDSNPSFQPAVVEGEKGKKTGQPKPWLLVR